MARNVTLQHCRGVDANKPTLSAGEVYCATDTGRVYHGTAPFRLTPVVGEADLVTQAAAVAATILFTPVVSGFYKINFYLKVTRAATTSSTLGSLTITFSDGTDSVAQSIVAQGQNQLGATGTTVATNTTVAILTGTVDIWAVAGTAVKYAIGYTSSGTTTMQYEAHLKAQLL
jgi:hypothetical protein